MKVINCYRYVWLLALVAIGCKSGSDRPNHVWAAAQVGQQVGFIDTLGNWIIEPKFSQLTYFSEGLGRMILNGKWGFIGTKGEFAIAPAYDNALDFSSGRAAVKLDSLWGFVDPEGQLVIPCQYRSIRPYFEGKAAVAINDRWTFIDLEGKPLFEPKFDAALTFGEGLIAVRDRLGDGRPGKWGFVDERGAWVIPPRYEAVPGERFRKGTCLVADSSGFYFIDKQGKNTFGRTFYRATDYFSDLAAVLDTSFRNQLEWGLIDRSGKKVIPPNYEVCDPRGFNQSGRIPVRRGRQFGFIDQRDSLVIPYRYDGVFPFTFRRSGVYTNGKFGFIDPAGNLVIKPQFDQVLPFHSSEANAFIEVDRQ